MPILTLQLLRDLRGHGARFIERSRLEADGADARVAAAAITLADAGQVVFGFLGAQGFDPTEILVRKLEGLTETVYVLSGNR